MSERERESRTEKKGMREGERQREERKKERKERTWVGDGSGWDEGSNALVKPCNIEPSTGENGLCPGRTLTYLSPRPHRPERGFPMSWLS